MDREGSLILSLIESNIFNISNNLQLLISNSTSNYFIVNSITFTVESGN